MRGSMAAVQIDDMRSAGQRHLRTAPRTSSSSRPTQAMVRDIRATHPGYDRQRLITEFEQAHSSLYRTIASALTRQLGVDPAEALEAVERASSRQLNNLLSEHSVHIDIMVSWAARVRAAALRELQTRHRTCLLR